MPQARLTEDQLCEEFADKLVSSPTFNQWLLCRTKFKADLLDVRLMHEVQSACRNAKRWWRHWWCAVPGLGESETDIMAVYERSDKTRFALHIENKLAISRWSSKNQARAYRDRAEFMLRKPRFMNCTDFATLIIAPTFFLTKWRAEVRKFDAAVSHESIAEFVPAFA